MRDAQVVVRIDHRAVCDPQVFKETSRRGVKRVSRTWTREQGEVHHPAGEIDHPGRGYQVQSVAPDATPASRGPQQPHHPPEPEQRWCHEARELGANSQARQRAAAQAPQPRPPTGLLVLGPQQTHQ